MLTLVHIDKMIAVINYKVKYKKAYSNTVVILKNCYTGKANFIFINTKISHLIVFGKHKLIKNSKKTVLILRCVNLGMFHVMC